MATRGVVLFFLLKMDNPPKIKYNNPVTEQASTSKYIIYIYQLLHMDWDTSIIS